MNRFVSFLQSVASVGEGLVPQELQAEDLGMTYITPRIIAMGFPYDDSVKSGSSVVALPPPSYSRASLHKVGKFLETYHKGKYMVFNLSEKQYDYSVFNNQVLEFNFPGYPSPPLKYVFTIITSLHKWIKADSSNIVVIHCQTGKGRTVCTIAWYLVWSTLIESVDKALNLIAKRMNIQLAHLIIPTQQRYLDYLSAMLAGVTPSPKTLILERIIMHGIPAFSLSPNGQAACRPYLQIFTDGELLFTSTGRDSTNLRWYTADDTSVLFPINRSVTGDILIRIRHLTQDGKRISILRFGFHTGFITPGNVRLNKNQLDGACQDHKRFKNDFFIDCIFREKSEIDAALEEEEKRERKQQQQQSDSKQDDAPEVDEDESEVSTRHDHNEAVVQAAEADFWQQVLKAREAIAKQKAHTTPIAMPVTQQQQQQQQQSKSKLPTAQPLAVASNPPNNKPAANPSSSSSSSMSQAFNKFKFSLFGSDDKSNDSEDEDEEKKSTKKTTTSTTDAPTTSSTTNTSGAASSASSATTSAPSGSANDSFADLASYVRGLGAVDATQHEVDSDDEANDPKKTQSVSTKASGSEATATSGASLTSQTKSEPKTASIINDLDNDDFIASLTRELPPSVMASAASSSSTATDKDKANNFGLDDSVLSNSDVSSLEAELALLSGDSNIDLGDMEEADMLAQLQKELNLEDDVFVKPKEKTNTNHSAELP